MLQKLGMCDLTCLEKINAVPFSFVIKGLNQLLSLERGLELLANGRGSP